MQCTEFEVLLESPQGQKYVQASAQPPYPPPRIVKTSFEEGSGTGLLSTLCAVAQSVDSRPVPYPRRRRREAARAVASGTRRARARRA